MFRLCHWVWEQAGESAEDPSEIYGDGSLHISSPSCAAASSNIITWTVCFLSQYFVLWQILVVEVVTLGHCLPLTCEFC